MRTTVEISDALAKKVRALMHKRNTSMRALIEEGLRKVVEEGARQESRFRLRDASAGGDGLADGVKELDWETMSRALYPRS
jgi:predicted transcriptional regulator